MVQCRFHNCGERAEEARSGVVAFLPPTSEQAQHETPRQPRSFRVLDEVFRKRADLARSGASRNVFDCAALQRPTRRIWRNGPICCGQTAVRGDIAALNLRYDLDHLPSWMYASRLCPSVADAKTGPPRPASRASLFRVPGFPPLRHAGGRRTALGPKDPGIAAQPDCLRVLNLERAPPQAGSSLCLARNRTKT